jgi:hypothetical protein
LVPRDSLKDILHAEQLTRLDRLLVVLAVEGQDVRKVGQVCELAIGAGLREAEKWNVSSILSASKGLAVRVKDGWSLTANGKKHVGTLLDKAGFKAKHAKFVSDLRTHLGKLSDPQTKAFVEEAISCFEHELWRAAVVLSWVGAVSVLQEHVITKCLSQFNAEAARRDSKWKQASTKDDLSRLKESDFLDILESISVLGKSVKTELKTCLDRRNGCGHPNSYRLGENMVAAHIEALVLNVFSRF